MAYLPSPHGANQNDQQLPCQNLCRETIIYVGVYIQSKETRCMPHAVNQQTQSRLAHYIQTFQMQCENREAQNVKLADYVMKKI